MIYLIHPRLSLPDVPLAETFCAGCDRELRRHALVSLIDAQSQLYSVEPTSEDAVVFFNHGVGLQYHKDILRILKCQAKSFPVAMSQELRVPPDAAGKSQSFDVHNELRQRGLNESNAATVAGVLARAVLSSLQPTLSQFKMRLFLSHRRADGEDLASWFYRELRQRAESGFQDLSDVFVGEDAQEVIEGRLVQSDAVIFLDTALAYESTWVAKELGIALSLNLPIVWVNAGGDENGKYLKVRPSATPHLKIGTVRADPRIVDQVLDQAFLLAREAGIRILDTARRLKDLSRENGLELIEKSQNKLLYSLRIPRRQFRYPESPMTHLVQFFGRRPKVEDKTEFGQLFKRQDEAPELGLLLGPIPPQDLGTYRTVAQNTPSVVVDSGEEYISALERYLTQSSSQGTEVRTIAQNAEEELRREHEAIQAISPGDERVRATGSVLRKGLIISGAFPDDCAPQYQQDLIDAVHAFALAVFDRGGTVIFGAHPIFVPLIFDMAKRRRPTDFREAVHLYFSTFFRGVPTNYEDNATVFAISSVAGDRNASLRSMRRAMVSDKEARGLVAIGGKYPRKGLSVGVDEEKELAVGTGLPAFLVGSVQGRSSQLAGELCGAGWKDKPNKLTDEQNEQLRTSLDFSSLANMVLNSIGI